MIVSNMTDTDKFILEITSEDFHHKQPIDKTQKAKIISFLMFPDMELNSVIPSSHMSNVDSTVGIQLPNEDGIPKVTQKTRKRAGKKQVKTSIRPEIENIDLQKGTTELKDYWSLSKGQRIVWILYLAQINGFDSLNYKEITKIAQKIKDNIPEKQISALTNTSIKNRRIATDLSNNVRIIRILEPGIRSLQKNNNSNLVE